jgi:hypothetical protein
MSFNTPVGRSVFLLKTIVALSAQAGLPEAGSAAQACGLDKAITADRRSLEPAYIADPRPILGKNAGAAEGIRTPDPRITNAVLYRLSYRG